MPQSGDASGDYKKFHPHIVGHQEKKHEISSLNVHAIVFMFLALYSSSTMMMTQRNKREIKCEQNFYIFNVVELNVEIRNKIKQE